MSVAAETPVAVEVPARDRLRSLAVTTATVGVPMLLVAGLALANGGSEPTQWGWVALLLLWTGATGVLLSRLELAWFDVVFLGGLIALLGWVAASLLWTNDVSHTLDEIQRVAVYPAAALAALGLGSRRALPQITAGVWAGGTVACSYALSTRLFPETFGDFDSTTTSYRLTDPFPYWNMLGGLAGLSLVVALGLAVRARPVWLRCLAAASLPLLALTLYFTFSRGGMAATAVALLVMLLLDPGRTRLATEGIVLALVPAAAVYAASQRDGLTRRNADLSVASSDGRSIALLLLVLMGAAVILTLLLTVAERRIRLSDDLRTAWTVILFGGLVALAAVATIPRGGPVDVAQEAWDSFNGAPIGTADGGDLTGRLFDASSNGRKELWTVALDQWRDHPVTGAGAGTFTAAFYARDDRQFDTENAHSLYFETLGELGIIGGLLVLLVVLTPLAAGIKARHEPLAVTALGGYLVIVVQAAVDTDWESPAVIVPALLLGGAVVAAARGRRLPVGPIGRGALVGFSILLAVVCGYALSANRAIDDAAAASETNPCAAVSAAERATDRMPWSARAWVALAGTRINAGDPEGARLAYRRALEQAPTDFRLWVASGAVQDPAAAATVFAKARQLNPHLEPDAATVPFDPVEFPRVAC